MKGFLGRLFDSNKKEIGRMEKLVERINGMEPAMQALSDDELRAKTDEFRKRHANGESLDALLPEAYAVVREASVRVIGQRHFDVQVIGGISLHEGKIAEMKTGEGKTLAATLPAYLNALTGRGVHVVTVNDYLARFHSEWMGQIYRFLGLQVGLILQGLSPVERKLAYACDVIYGTNSEFGFDYLRDNMAATIDHVVQRDLYYAIIDEVDSILIDEARTPLIISGRTHAEDDITGFTTWKGYVEGLVRRQKRLIAALLRRADQAMEKGDEEEAAEILIIIKYGDPKNVKFLELSKRPGMNRLMDRAEREHGKSFKDVLNENLLYYFADSDTSVTPVDREISSLADTNPEIKAFFDRDDVEPDDESADLLSEDESATEAEQKEALKARGSRHYADICTLIKAYALFEKDVAYVVQDGKVIIVDEFTGRLMHGRRYSHGLHQAIEAKENVRIEEITRTMASVTIQNYFRMYEKLSGMTGTAATEEQEFLKIYRMEVVEIPTNRPMVRDDMPDYVYKTERVKYEKVADEIVERHRQGQPILVGTISVEKSEYLSGLLKKRGVRHQVLNAKLHAQEADIVAQAGRPGAVTIATNMAGRGTDILLGGNPEFMARAAMLAAGANPDDLRDINLRKDPEIAELRQAYEGKLAEFSAVTRAAGEEVRALGGLHIIGTERHESRRIDNQLRGRAGRQGDPGSSRFYLSLDDDLMRLFGGDMVYGLMDKLGVEEDMPIEHGMLSSAIARAQEKIETRNYEMRKHVLEYDDVLNKQREIIYEQRRAALERDLTETIDAMLEDVLDGVVTGVIPEKIYPEEWDVELLRKSLADFIPVTEANPESWRELSRDKLRNHIVDMGRKALARRRQELGPGICRDLQRMIVLRVIDNKWMTHLDDMEDLRKGIGLRAYGQRDPLVEYKLVGYEVFQQNVVEELKEDVIRYMFRVQVITEPRSQATVVHKPQPGTVTASGPSISEKSVGRNDPCPCGSGKKYKRCCGRDA